MRDTTIDTGSLSRSKLGATIAAGMTAVTTILAVGFGVIVPKIDHRSPHRQRNAVEVLSGEDDPDQRSLPSVKRLNSQAWDASPASLPGDLAPRMIQILHLADHDGGAVFLVVAPDGRGIASLLSMVIFSGTLCRGKCAPLKLTAIVLPLCSR